MKKSAPGGGQSAHHSKLHLAQHAHACRQVQVKFMIKLSCQVHLHAKFNNKDIVYRVHIWLKLMSKCNCSMNHLYVIDAIKAEYLYQSNSGGQNELAQDLQLHTFS